MKRITEIRHGLNSIEGAMADLPPEDCYRGEGPGIRIDTLHWAENPNFVDQSSLLDFSDDDVSRNANDFAGQHGAPDFDPVFEIGAAVDETFPALGGTEGERIRQSVLARGVDALGWYVPFHCTGAQWGAYVSVSGMGYLIREAFAGLTTGLETKAQLAFHAILNHELFHFATEYAIAQAELAHQEPWYVAAKKAFRRRTPSYCDLEEKLANAYMLKAFRSAKPALRLRGKQAALKDFIRGQPAGYNEGASVVCDDWSTLLGDLAWCYGEHPVKSQSHPALWLPGLGFDWAAQFPIHPKIDWHYCPIHLVRDEARIGIPATWLNWFSRLERISETDGFLKRLHELAPPIQRAWDRTKRKLSVCITNGADFKRWSPAAEGVYSVRVNDSIRAHLRKVSNAGDWSAIAIGGHKEMGHG